MMISKSRAIVSKRSKGDKSIIMFFVTIAMASTITVPTGSKLQQFFDAAAAAVPLIRTALLTRFFQMYNVIGISTLCLLGILVLYFISKENVRHSLSVSEIILVLWTALQVIYCIAYIEYSTVLWQPMLLICLLFLFKEQKYTERFIKVVIRFGVLNAILTIVQFAYWDTGTSFFDALRIYRPAAFFPDATTSAIYMSISVAFVLFCMPLSKLRSILCLATLATGCLLNGSRNALVLILIAVVLFLLRKHSGRRTMILICFLVLGIGVLLVSDSLSTKAFDAVSSFLYDNTRSTRIKIALNLFSENPVFGSGLRAYDAAVAGYGFSNTVHNIYAMILCKYGLVGFTLFIVPLITAIICGFKQNRFAMCLLIMLATGAYVSGVETSLAIQIIWYFVYAMVLTKKQTSSEGVWEC